MKIKKVIILTGNEHRHTFFRKFIAINRNIKVLSTYCEKSKGAFQKIINDREEDSLSKKHLKWRDESEKDFFEVFNKYTPDFSKPIEISKGEINNEKIVADIINKEPDLLIAYGSSIIKSRLLEVYKDRFINIHLGLSPYYRGSGTNFWPFVNDELQFVGTTFMFIDSGIDTGKIIHQIRAKMFEVDNIHTIGNRLIKDTAKVCANLITNFDEIVDLQYPELNDFKERYYRKKDYTEDVVLKAYKNLKEGIIKKYLLNKGKIDKQFPIVQQPNLTI